MWPKTFLNDPTYEEVLEKITPSGLYISNRLGGIIDGLIGDEVGRSLLFEVRSRQFIPQGLLDLTEPLDES